MATLTLPGGQTLYYEVHGSGPALLLASGLSGVATFWDEHIPHLAEAFTVIAHDHCGTGRSSLELIDFSVEQMAGDVLCLMDHLQIEHAHYIGHSTGGAMGQVLAIDHPQRIDRLVLSATWARSDPYFKLLFEIRASTLEHEGAAAYLRTNGILFKPPRWVRAHADEFRYTAEQAGKLIPDPRITLARIDAITRFDRLADLPRIRCPTLVLCARDDLITPAYFSVELGQNIANARTVIEPEGGHFYPQVHPEVFRTHVISFLQDPAELQPLL